MKPELAEVHTLYESNPRSIVDMLRAAADSIGTEEDDPGCSPTTAVVMIQLAENGDVQVYGWGKTDDMHAIGMIELGKSRLIADMTESDD